MFNVLIFNVRPIVKSSFLFSLALLEIDLGNWLTLPDDLPGQEGTFDAVICLGNSFANLPDFEGNLNNQRIALKNFADFLRPGGIMIIDHRNYDAILDTGRAPVQNIYYHVSGNVDQPLPYVYCMHSFCCCGGEGESGMRVCYPL